MMPYYVIGVKLGFSVDSLCKEASIQTRAFNLKYNLYTNNIMSIEEVDAANRLIII